MASAISTLLNGRWIRAFIFLTLMAASWSGRGTLGATSSRPNLIVILSDDMGFSDIGCYGSEIETPNLDRLAAEGLRFTQFYNGARCCPTRASLLTGLHPHQAGVGWMMADGGREGYRGELNRRSVTIAEALRPAGYSTYAVGKWHVTGKVRPEGPQEQGNWPLQRGFDRFYGTIHGAGSFFDPNSLTRDNTLISPAADPEYRPDRFYYTDAISDHAIRFIREHAENQADQPFFMYVAYTAAHWPMHALEEDIAKYRGRYDDGYAPIREARLKKARELGLIDERWRLSDQAGDWDRVENQEWEARCMEVYAAMVDRMDQGIGRIARELERRGLNENTVIFFLQDNGGCAEGLGRRASGEYKTRPEAPPFEPMADDELQYRMIPRQTRDGYPVVQGPGIMPGGPDSYIAYGRAWANVSNTPFREYKHWVHEGGISTPLIVHWPAGIDLSQAGRGADTVARRSAAGALVDELGHLVDIMATCVDLAQADYPKEKDGQSIHPMEGVSLRPLFEGEVLRRERPLCWEHEGNRAIRDGRWKLVAKENQPWELYDMEADRTELNDLVTQHPERARELEKKWDAWAERAFVLPLGAWRDRAAP